MFICACLWIMVDGPRFMGPYPMLIINCPRLIDAYIRLGTCLRFMDACVRLIGDCQRYMGTFL